MRNVNRRKTSPLKYTKSRRNHPIQHGSSTMPGVAHPVAFIPMFREDALTARIDCRVEMLETKELLMNPVTARFTSWLVPFLAFERFAGSRDEFDRSYMGEASLNGDGVIPFMDNDALPVGGAGAVPLYLAAGLHGLEGDQINTGYREAYNLVYNHRAKLRSMKLTPREMTDTSLAPAFWNHTQFPHIVADFDQALIDGQVALNIVNQRIDVKGLYYSGSNSTPPGTAFSAHDGKPHPFVGPRAVLIDRGAGTDSNPEVFAEMAEAGITVSLANIEQAKRTAAFARLRQQYEGHDDEYIIDMLMQGLSIPDQHLKQPIALGDVTVRFEQGKRFATDSGNLDDSATSGGTRADIRLRVPRINTGGVVVVLMEILPSQLWERQQDWFFHTRPKDGRAGHDYWPDAERDTLDAEKVDVVYNRDIDVSHSEPNAYFGFEPMNAKFNRAPPTIGGKFHRPAADALSDDARQRLWAVEGSDPSLTDSFFIVEPGTMHIKPFLDEVSDPFEIVAQGNAVISGITQFGGLLIEATGNYDKVAAHAPTDKIEKE